MLQSLLSLNAFAQAGGNLGPAAGSLAHFASLGNLASIESLSSFSDVREYLAANSQGFGGSISDETAAGILRDSLPALLQQRQGQGAALAASDPGGYRQMTGGLPDNQLRAYDRRPGQPSQPPQRMPERLPPTSRLDPFSNSDQQTLASRVAQHSLGMLGGGQQEHHAQLRQQQQQQQAAQFAAEQLYATLPDARWGAQLTQQQQPSQSMQWAQDSSRFAGGHAGHGDRRSQLQFQHDRSSIPGMGARDVGFENQGPGSPSAHASKRQATEYPRSSHDRSQEDHGHVDMVQKSQQMIQVRSCLHTILIAPDVMEFMPSCFCRQAYHRSNLAGGIISSSSLSRATLPPPSRVPSLEPHAQSLVPGWLDLLGEAFLKNDNTARQACLAGSGKQCRYDTQTLSVLLSHDSCGQRCKVPIRDVCCMTATCYCALMIVPQSPCHVVADALAESWLAGQDVARCGVGHPCKKTPRISLPHPLLRPYLLCWLSCSVDLQSHALARAHCHALFNIQVRMTMMHLLLDASIVLV